MQDTLPCRPQVCGERGVASCDVGQLLKLPKDPSDQAPATNGMALLPQKARKIRSERARHAAAPAQFVWGRGVASCDVDQLFKPLKGSQTQRRQRHGALDAISAQDTLPCRPQVFG